MYSMCVLHLQKEIQSPWRSSSQHIGTCPLNRRELLWRCDSSNLSHTTRPLFHLHIHLLMSQVKLQSDYISPLSIFTKLAYLLSYNVAKFQVRGFNEEKQLSAGTHLLCAASAGESHLINLVIWLLLSLFHCLKVCWRWVWPTPSGWSRLDCVSTNQTPPHHTGGTVERLVSCHSI